MAVLFETEVPVVSRDDEPPSRVQRLLNASWPIFRAFGVDVRIHWLVVVVPVVAFGLFVKGGVAAEAAATWAVPFTIAVYVATWTHEMAHVATARRLGAPTRDVTLSPLGALAHVESRIPTPTAEVLVALAGVVSQTLWVIALGVPWFAFHVDESAALHRPWAEIYQWFLAWQTALVAFNLVPCHPMDCGRALRGFLAAYAGPVKASQWTAQVGYGLSLVLAIAGAALLLRDGARESVASLAFGSLLTFVGVGNFLACRQLAADARPPAPQFEPIEAWGGDRPEEPWKDTVAESERLARAEERRERRAAEARRQEEAGRQKLQERIDQLLDRINEVGGVENLPPAERRELAEASESLRRETAEG